MVYSIIPGHMEFNGHPLIARIIPGCGVDAMLLDKGISYIYIKSRCAEVSGSPVPFTTEQLSFNGYREALVKQHTFGGLAMKHSPVVPECPFLSAGYLLAHETVFNPQDITRK